MVDFGQYAKSLAGVVAVSGLYGQPFLFYGQADFAKSRFCFVRRIAQAVLVPQFLFQAGIDLLDGLFLGDFIKTAPGLLGNLLQDLFAVGPVLRVSRTSISTAAAHASASETPASLSIPLLVGEQDRVSQYIRSLRRFNG